MPSISDSARASKSNRWFAQFVGEPFCGGVARNAASGPVGLAVHQVDDGKARGDLRARCACRR